MYEEQEFITLEEEERDITDETITTLLLILAATKGNLEKELRNFYQKYGKDGVVTYAEARKWAGNNDHRRRLTALLVFINENFNEVQDKLSPIFQSLLKDVIGKETEFFETDVDSQDILSEPWGTDNRTWADRLSDDVSLWSLYISTDIKRAIHQRKHLDDVLAQLDKRFKSIDRVLTSLGLSESTAVGSMARREIFKQLGITKYQFYTRADERTCETCGAMHGIVFPISAFEIGVTASPLHPRCRCWEVPILE